MVFGGGGGGGVSSSRRRRRGRSRASSRRIWSKDITGNEALESLGLEFQRLPSIRDLFPRNPENKGLRVFFRFCPYLGFRGWECSAYTCRQQDDVEFVSGRAYVSFTVSGLRTTLNPKP